MKFIDDKQHNKLNNENFNKKPKIFGFFYFAGIQANLGKISIDNDILY